MSNTRRNIIFHLAEELAEESHKYRPVKKYESRSKMLARTIENILFEYADDLPNTGHEEEFQELKELAEDAYRVSGMSSDDMNWVWKY